MMSNNGLTDDERCLWEQLVAVLPFDWKLLPPDTCLVGGWVRDVLLKREKKLIDIDLIIPENTILLAKKIARQYQAGFVVLDEIRQIARVIFPQATVDFAQLEGNNLQQDLYRRDYTLNAIAFDLYKQQLIDPLQGKEDIQKNLMRMVSKDNLEDDPLRLLRGYRQAMQLNFFIEEKTQETLCQLGYLMTQVAGERVQAEVSYFLDHPQGGDYLLLAWKDGILSGWLPYLQEEQIKTIIELETKLDLSLLNRYLFLHSFYLKMAKLTCLLSSDVKRAEEMLLNLKYSKLEIRTVLTALKGLQELQVDRTLATNLRKQYFFFQLVGGIFPVIFLIGLVTPTINPNTLEHLASLYEDSNNQIAHPQPLINGKELMQSLNLSPSPLIGQILTEIQLARIEGRIDSIPEAIEWAKQFIP